jgi:hypothetical protein
LISLYYGIRGSRHLLDILLLSQRRGTTCTATTGDCVLHVRV